MVKLKDTEQIDDLQIKNLKIIQDNSGFKFGVDAVLLANYTKVKNNGLGVDLCTGTGIIPIIIEGKSNPKRIDAIEIQEEVSEMASRSVLMNNQQEKIKIFNGDLREISNILEGHIYDFVTCNPPYMNIQGLSNDSLKVQISKQELMCTLEDVFKAASYLLKQGGYFYMVHRPNRIIDISIFSRKYKLELKEICFIHPTVNKPSNLALYKFCKNGKPDLKIKEPLYIYDENGKYTDKINEIYNSETLGVI